MTKKEIQVAFACLDCSMDTGYGHYYMVHDDVWLKANPARSGMLCLCCLVTRLGRPLYRDDFTDAVINHRLKLCFPIRRST